MMRGGRVVIENENVEVLQDQAKCTQGWYWNIYIYIIYNYTHTYRYFNQILEMCLIVQQNIHLYVVHVVTFSNKVYKQKFCLVWLVYSITCDSLYILHCYNFINVNTF